MDAGVAEAAMYDEGVTASSAITAGAAEAAYALSTNEEISLASISAENAALADALGFASDVNEQSNVNTALAFTTIEQLVSGNSAAQEAEANQAAAAQLNAANGYGVSGTTGSAIAASGSTTTSGAGGTTTTTGSSLLSTAGGSSKLTNLYYLVGIAAAGVALWYYFKTKKLA